ncbi:MAG TPA: lipid-A-disaccharide synthase [Thermoanaerobaculia bacterium]|nr:lipid-A-disaccharide synthase [Thermoanaerobaculia bacterium]
MTVSGAEGPPQPTLLVVAGEASGDLHAARLVGCLRRHCPGLAAFGMGGDELAAAGVELVAHSGEVAVVGITEVLKVLPRVRQVFRLLLDEARRRRPTAAVLVDFPDFNLRLARGLARLGVPVVYYVSPQVWAWRSRRVRTIARTVDRMLVLFPFELDFYRARGVDAVHVGHPLVDEVPQLPQVWDRGPEPAGAYRVALLPGSRRSEVEALLPDMLAAVGRMRREAAIEARVVRAHTVPRALIERLVAASGERVEVVERERFAAVADSHLALCASGTATLEVGLLGTPMVVLYRVQPWTYRLARLLVKLPAFSLVNLVLGERVVPELLQEEVEPERVAAEALALLRDRQRRERLRAGLAGLRQRLGEGGASERAAREVAAVLGCAPLELAAEVGA